MGVEEIGEADWGKWIGVEVISLCRHLGKAKRKISIMIRGTPPPSDSVRAGDRKFQLSPDTSLELANLGKGALRLAYAANAEYHLKEIRTEALDSSDFCLRFKFHKR